jgi:hypothetical protein
LLSDSSPFFSFSWLSSFFFWLLVSVLSERTEKTPFRIWVAAAFYLPAGWVCEEGVYVLLGGTLSLDTFSFEGFGGVSGCQSFCFFFPPQGMNTVSTTTSREKRNSDEVQTLFSSCRTRVIVVNRSSSSSSRS